MFPGAEFRSRASRRRILFWLLGVFLFALAVAQPSSEVEQLLMHAERAPSPQAAKKLYEDALQIAPNDPFALSGLAYVVGEEGNHLEAASLFKKAAQQPHSMRDQTYFNAGYAYLQAGSRSEALEMFLFALQVNPSFVPARVKVAYLYTQMGKPDEAERQLREAIRAAPKNPELYLYLGDVLNNVKRWTEATQAYEQSIALNPRNPLAHRNLGDVLSNRGLQSEALEHYRAAYKLDQSPASVVGILHAQRELNIWRNWDIVLRKTEDGVRDMLRRGMHSPLSPYQTLFLPMAPKFALEIAKSWADRTVMTELQSTKSSLDLMRDFMKSPHTFFRIYNQRLRDFESRVQQAFNLAGLHDYCRKVLPTHASFVPAPIQTGLQIPEVFQPLLQRRLRVGYLSRRFERYPGTQLMLRMFGLHDRSAFEVYSYAYGPDDSSEERQIVRDTSDVFRDVWGLDPASVARRIAEDEIDVLIDYDGAHNFNSLAVLAHRPAPVQVTFLGFAGTTGASQIVDYIVVDPIIAPPSNVPPQVTDTFVKRFGLPHRLRHLVVGNSTTLVNFLSETPLYMPYTYQPQDYRSSVAPTPSRAQLGLPERVVRDFDPKEVERLREQFPTNLTRFDNVQIDDFPVVDLPLEEQALNKPQSTEGFVFVCFNRNNKYEPDSFAAWAAILRATPGSVLWLLSADSVVEANLRAAAVEYGVDPRRLVFAGREPKPVHLARHKRADLFIDTFFYTAHTTASDALYVGLPVLTVANQTFASRVSASIVLAAGLPELVADSQTDFVRRAVRLARYPRELEALKTRLERLLDAHLPDRHGGNAEDNPQSAYPLFNTPLFVRAMEAAVSAARTRYACNSVETIHNTKMHENQLKAPLVVNPEHIMMSPTTSKTTITSQRDEL